jgi:hypothetical protein
MGDHSLRRPDPRDAGNHAAGFPLAEAARRLDLAPEAVQRLSRRFAGFLGPDCTQRDPRFSSPDLAALATVQQLLAQGYDDDQVRQRLAAPAQAPAEAEAPPAAVEIDLQAEPSRDLAPARSDPAHEASATLARMVSDTLNSLAGTQQAVLNGQSAMREMLNVVVHDNFNLKDENRKLRERMLELERVLAEYQRREETRKERIEGRLRGLEATVAALQQQVAQLVQIQRQQQQRRGWFG